MSELADRLVGCVDNGYGPNLDLIAKVVDTLREQDKRIAELEKCWEEEYNKCEDALVAKEGAEAEIERLRDLHTSSVCGCQKCERRTALGAGGDE